MVVQPIEGGGAVLPPAEPDEFRYARTMPAMSQSTLREVLALASRPGVLSLAVGLPAVELFPAADLARVTSDLLARDPGALNYGIPYQPLKARIVEMMAARGVDCRPEQVFLTTGSQQSMDLLVHMLVDPGAPVLLEETVYDGIQMAMKRLGARPVTVPTDPETGIDVDAIEALLEGGLRPALLYTITDGHNPLGVSISLEKRRRLAELARRHRLPILEDDAYGFLYFGSEPAPPLRAFEDRWVFYLGSFSKTLAPALRAGWAVVPEELVPRLAALKHAADLDTPSFTHRVIAAYLETGRLPEHLALLRGEYRRRRDVILQALDRYFPPGLRWTRPEAGMFVWVELPAGLDTAQILRRAVEDEQVAFSPGVAFAAGGSHANHCLRLNFTFCQPEQIEEGVRRLARVLTAVLG
ncbi:MAG TPA: PLP-dependent aminotransferase family protein [Thermoanaerobaculia bacterium]|nr:PLP-dependent aminotransferase family protein [Thermoanaerobaculia bacterium]